MDRLTIFDSSRLYREALRAYLVPHFPSLIVMTGEALTGESRIDMNGAPLFTFHRDILNARDVAAQVGRRMGRDDTGLASLTRREREVLSYLVRGDTNKQIARALSLREVTVKLHVRGICRKLDVQNRTQAALKGRENLFE